MADRRSSVRFPGESDAYRAARDDLLRDEIALRRQTEAVAAKRRALPLGGLVPEDYEFAVVVTTAGAGATHAMRLSELFRRGRNTLVVYSFMLRTTDEAAVPVVHVDPGCVGRRSAAHHAAGQSRRRRKVVAVWPLWNVFDYTPDGRGTTWNPSLEYEPW
jgi:predicted dithiol-disulfide oxidoreductase (DUF899 family)